MNALLTPSRFSSRLIVVALSWFTLASLGQAEQPCLPDDACQLRYEEELCGWTGPATHDSIAYRYIPDSEPSSASDTTADGSITQGAAIALAAAGISIEQLLEPLALVAPYLDNSLETVRRYQSWWGAAIATADRIRQEEALVAEQLALIASEEPIDACSYGPSVVVDEFPLSVQRIPAGEPGIEILPLNRLVGSSAIIVTIEESYLPYDLSAEDLKLWSVLPSSTHPFCIRAQGDGWDAAAMWQAFDERVATTVAAMADSSDANEPVAVVEPVLAYCGSADCLLESWIWHSENWVAEHSDLLTAVTASNVGRQVTEISLRREQLVHVATNLIASRWGAAVPMDREESSPEASDAGAALLARAGAVAAAEPVIEMAANANRLR